MEPGRGKAPQDQNSLKRANPIAARLLDVVCEQLGDSDSMAHCCDRKRFLGALDSGLMESWLRHAPAMIGAKGIETTLDSMPARIRFELLPGQFSPEETEGGDTLVWDTEGRLTRRN